MVSCRCSSNPWNSTTQPMSTPKIPDDPSRNHHFPQFKSQVPLPTSAPLRHSPSSPSSARLRSARLRAAPAIKGLDPTEMLGMGQQKL